MTWDAAAKRHRRRRGRQRAARRRAVDRHPVGRRRPGHRRLDDAHRRGEGRGAAAEGRRSEAEEHAPTRTAVSHGSPDVRLQRGARHAAPRARAVAGRAAQPGPSALKHAARSTSTRRTCRPRRWPCPACSRAASSRSSIRGAIVNRRISQPAVRTMLDDGMKALTGETAPAERLGAVRRRRPTSSRSRSIRRARRRRSPRSRCCARSSAALNAAGVPNQQHHRLRPELESARGQRLPHAGAGRRARGRPRSALVGEGSRRGRAATTRRSTARWTVSASARPAPISRASSRREADKIINLPCLKEHNASGVTGCLKNLAYGSFNNVARTHVGSQDLHRSGDRGDVQRRRRCDRSRCSTSWTACAPCITAARSPGIRSSSGRRRRC